jgi:dTDP-4-amino-4,6-dideoxygalactose transaminase
MAASLTAVRPVSFAPPDLGEAEIGEVCATLASGWLSTGPRVHRFEREFAAYVGAPHALALSSCTAGLHLALLASNIGPGDEAITTPLTFCATANVVVHTGAQPVFADIDPATWILDPLAAAAAITVRTRTIIPVHYAGRPAAMRAFESIARPHDIVLIEDAAHCVEGVDAGRKIGAIGDFTCFSFYATKNLTTGEGGMVTTANARAAERMRMLSNHGIDRDAWSRYAPGAQSDYAVRMAGFKYNMMDLQAAIGLHQLARLGGMHARRATISARYDAALADLPLTRPAPVSPLTVHAHHLYPVLVDPAIAGVTRDALQDALRTRGISTSVHFRALHLQPYYQERYGLRRGMFPNAERVSDQTLSLPLSSALSNADVDRVIEALHECLF